MRFVYTESFVTVAFKADNFSGNMSALGGAMPDGALAVPSVDVQGRYFTLWLYDDEGRTYLRRYPFASIPIEDGGPDGITSINVTGNPYAVNHAGAIKLFYANYFEGPKPEQLFRLNSGWRVAP